jgi:hypothetical protein
LTAFKPGFYDHSHCKQGEKPREAAAWMQIAAWQAAVGLQPGGVSCIALAMGQMINPAKWMV